MITSTAGITSELLEKFGPSPEIFVFVALATLPLIGLFVPWVRGSQPTWVIVMALALALFVLYGVLSFRISLSIVGVRYRSPLGRYPLLAWSSITRVRTGAKPIGRRTYPPYFMEIHTRERELPVVINIKFFSRKALVRLATLICERASQADLDKDTELLANGTFPSVFFSG
jgi:hypothetical protein